MPVTLGVRDTDEHTLALEQCDADLLREGEAVPEAVMAPVTEVEKERNADTVAKGEPDTDPVTLEERVTVEEALVLGHVEADMLREGEGVAVILLVAVGDAEGERVTDTEVEVVLVKGWVVPMPELVRLGIQVRVAPDWLAPSPSEPLGDTLEDPVTVMLGDVLGETVPEADRHEVIDTEGEADTDPAMLDVRVTDTVTEGEEEAEGDTLVL